MKIQLKKAIKHKGQDIYSLDIPLEDLTGNDLIEVEEDIARSGTPFSVTDLSRVYCIAVAAKAAHMAPEALRMMSARDFSRVVGEVRVFLMNTDSDTEETGGDSAIPATSQEISSDE